MLISSSKRFAFFITCVHSLFFEVELPLSKNLLDSFTSFCSFSLFNFQGPARHLLGDSFLIISHTFPFVNNFFLLSTSFFQTSLCISLSLSEQLIYYSTFSQFVNYFFILFSFSSCYLRHALLSVPVLYTYFFPLSTLFF